MASFNTPARALSQKPNTEFLHKQAKRLARDEALQLAAAQFRLAHEYGYRNWAELMNAARTSALPDAPAAKLEADSGANEVTSRAANVIPLLPLRELVAFPHVSYPIFVGRRKSIDAVLNSRSEILLASQKDPLQSRFSESEIYSVGTVGTIVQIHHLPDGTLRCLAEGRYRARVRRIILDDDFFKAEIETLDEPASDRQQLEDLVSLVVSAFAGSRVKSVLEGTGKPESFAIPATTTEAPSIVADRIASLLPLKLEDKQALLEMLNPRQRLEKLLEYLTSSK